MSSLAESLRVTVWPVFGEVIAVTRGAFEAFARHRTNRMAAALAYYTLFSLFPLFLLFLSVIGFLLDAGWPAALEAREYLLAITEEALPAVGDLVIRAIESIQAGRGASWLIGLFGLLWSASGTFNQLHIALDQIWGFNGKSGFRLTAKRRVMSVLFVLSLGLFLFLAQALKSVTHWLTILTDQLPGGSSLISVGTWLFPFVVAVLVFGVMYRTFPSLPICWRDVWPGAVLAGIGWELLKWLFVIYTAEFANWQAVYGPVAGVIGLLTWLYFSFTIILFGAEFAAALGSARTNQVCDEIGVAPPMADVGVERSPEDAPLPERRREHGRGLVSGTAAGVIGVVAAVVIGVGVLVGGIRRSGRSAHG
jgi:membrane protein